MERWVLANATRSSLNGVYPRHQLKGQCLNQLLDAFSVGLSQISHLIMALDRDWGIPWLQLLILKIFKVLLFTEWNICKIIIASFNVDWVEANHVRYRIWIATAGFRDEGAGCVAESARLAAQIVRPSLFRLSNLMQKILLGRRCIDLVYSSWRGC